jgi:preprotein translocase subunit SecE
MGLFYRQVVAELRKVIWPTRRELITYTTVVLAFVTSLTIIVAILDNLFGRAVLLIFGGN